MLFEQLKKILNTENIKGNRHSIYRAEILLTETLMHSFKIKETKVLF